MTKRQLIRLGAGSVLLAQSAAAVRIQSAVKQVSEEAAADARHKRDAAILALILTTSRRMADKVTDAIKASRSEARDVGRHRLVAELAANDVHVHPDVWKRPLTSGAAIERAQIDAVHAQAAAESLATQWRSMSVYRVSAARREGTDPVAAIADTTADMRPRSDRTADTEAAQAYNDERTAALDDALRYDSDLTLAIESADLVREWCALLDACPICAPLDGEQAPIGQSFDGGAEPGFQHVRCRCFSIYVPSIAAGIRRAA